MVRLKGKQNNQSASQGNDKKKTRKEKSVTKPQTHVNCGFMNRHGDNLFEACEYIME
jgi:hypothetical protein